MLCALALSPAPEKPFLFAHGFSAGVSQSHFSLRLLSVLYGLSNFFSEQKRARLCLLGVEILKGLRVFLEPEEK